MEAKDLVGKGSVLSISNKEKFSEKMNVLVNDSLLRNKLGKDNYNYIIQKSGATDTFMSYIEEKN